MSVTQGDDSTDSVSWKRASALTGAESLVRAARSQGVSDPKVLEALYFVPRGCFLPAQLRDEAGGDYAIPIGQAQTTSQPSLIALMIEALQLKPEDTVLEVGTGFGYETALLARLVRQVFSVERLPELATVARRNLAQEGASNLEVITGDGTLGLPGRAPFDAIVVAAAFVSVPLPLADQLHLGGRLVMPVGNGEVEVVTLYEKRLAGLTELRLLCKARFVPLVGANGYGAD
jgi:protein-L-isoaspartate(D-aspartate) O-methyltransferase